MSKWKKKPVVIDAIQLTERIEITTLEGVMVGDVGDWLITGVKGEKYPCKDDIFRLSYEPVDESALTPIVADSSADCPHDQGFDEDLTCNLCGQSVVRRR